MNRSNLLKGNNYEEVSWKWCDGYKHIQGWYDPVMKPIQTIGEEVKVCCRWAISDFTDIRHCVDGISSHSSFVTRNPNCVTFLQSRLFVKCFTRLLQLPLEWSDWDPIRSVKFFIREIWRGASFDQWIWMVKWFARSFRQ